MWTLLRPVVPSVGLLGRLFCVSVTVSCLFPSRFLGQSLSFVTGGHCWLDSVYW